MGLNSSNMLKTASVLALMGSGSHDVVVSANNHHNHNIGMTKKKLIKRKTSNNNKHHNKGRDLTEDIEFWTRMTQATGGSIPINTPRPTPFPTNFDSEPPVPVPVDTPIPTVLIVDPTEPPVPVDTPIPDTPIPTVLIVDPTDPPTMSGPLSPAPTAPLPCGLTPDERAVQLRQLALTITDEATLNDATSSQAKALDWLINEDKLDPPVCPDDGTCQARQRYIMASFYYASGGGSWDQCNAPNQYTPAAIAAANLQCGRVVTPFPVNNPRIGDTSTDAWLTPVNECEWGGTPYVTVRYGCVYAHVMCVCIYRCVFVHMMCID